MYAALSKNPGGLTKRRAWVRYMLENITGDDDVQAFVAESQSSNVFADNAVLSPRTRRDVGPEEASSIAARDR
jgi:hypothetical protein